MSTAVFPVLRMPWLWPLLTPCPYLMPVSTWGAYGTPFTCGTGERWDSNEWWVILKKVQMFFFFRKCIRKVEWASGWFSVSGCHGLMDGRWEDGCQGGIPQSWWIEVDERGERSGLKRMNGYQRTGTDGLNGWNFYLLTVFDPPTENYGREKRKMDLHLQLKKMLMRNKRERESD